MNLSVSELEALVYKALRGAGYPWGLAEEGAADARELVYRDLDPVPALCGVLRWRDEVPYAQNRSQCAISAGATIGDWGEWILPPDHDLGGEIGLGLIVEPLLLIPGVQRLATSIGEDIVVKAADAEARVARSVVSLYGSWSTGPVQLRLGTGDVPLAPWRAHEVQSRIEVGEDDLALLTRWAHRTYAPASDASRRAGAGAGLTDND